MPLVYQHVTKILRPGSMDYFWIFGACHPRYQPPPVGTWFLRQGLSRAYRARRSTCPLFGLRTSFLRCCPVV